MEPNENDFSTINERTPLLESSSHTMAEKVGVSQQTLVSDTNLDGQARKLPQYAAGLASTLGAMAAGMVLGWTSPAGLTVEGTNITKLAHEYEISISSEEFSWIGSLTTLGAAAICVPIGILSDIIGRKISMLMLVVPFTIGWGLIIGANSVALFYAGRFILGVSGGAFCVAAPIYAGEIGQSEIRGQLGSYFQLMMTVGILLTYALGMAVDILWLSVISAIVPIIFFAAFIFMPESPTYHLMKGNMDAARASMAKLRGPDYNVEPELLTQQETLDEMNRNRVSFLTAIRSKAAKKGLIIAFGLMFFQQLSGVNAIIFYAGKIFAAAGSSMSSEVSTVIVGVMQCVAVFVSTLIVDKLGRRILLLISEVAMCLTTLIVGVFFILQEQKQDVSAIGWLPLTGVCLFIVLFSLGFGPIPWMMIGEVFSLQTKGTAGSAACLFNWLMAFIVTKFFSNLTESFGNGATFIIFSVICGIGVVFVYFLVPETKGKTLQEIQSELEGN
ncbi:facilitated trehalose transporter Tret1-like isoform X1 [Leptopilina heterotoma]|uniref:facilitated trehalose transporter Tret1-like isoform X1 n=2 Tax=Leptopilina heterotoma TaxID=63436 RepID=UPI001CA9D727|nr:facilitated trehalose transporter Tret1-like isoform X1 [Leptopilina heterotoma]